MSAPAWSAFAVALIVAALATPVVVRLARRAGFLDRPSERSSHLKVTPRGGGLAIVLAVVIAVGVLEPAPEARVLGVLLGGLVLALLGLADDRFDLPVLPRLLAQVVAAVLAVAATGAPRRFPLPPPLDLELGPAADPLAVLWILVVVNACNFMDGIDGLAALQSAVTGAAIALAAWDPSAGGIAAAASGASLGFLFYNWSPARIFMGDVGSVFLGYTLAVLPLLAPADAKGGAMLFTALSLSPFIADTTYTRLRRIRRGGRWWAPHREHLYQRLVVAGWGHSRVALLIGAIAACTSSAALAASRARSPLGAWGAIALGLGLFLGEVLLVRRVEARS
jgi:UDP-N-acetylmuramyl pentapeptide phosphotransferase/UDP-N-acetylglucosamine-1-phosphate transferase